MHRHGPHIIGVVKSLLLGLALYLSVRLGYAAELRTGIENLLHPADWAVLPGYWLMVMLGSFVLTFPLTLLQDHLARALEEHPEETPTLFWLRSLAMETAVGSLIGCATTYLMLHWPHAWWLVWTALWSTYHFASTRAPHMGAAAREEDLIQHPELLAELNPRLETGGIRLVRVYALPEPGEDWGSDDDLVLLRGEEGAIVYLPHEWIMRWSSDELVAVILHKAWLTRRRHEQVDIIVNTLTALACFALFHLVPSSEDVLMRASLLFAWTVVMLPVFQLPALAYFRKTMVSADDVVSRQMHSPDALIRVLERATRDYPADAATPAWAERLFYNAPTLERRITRMKQMQAPGARP